MELLDFLFPGGKFLNVDDILILAPDFDLIWYEDVFVISIDMKDLGKTVVTLGLIIQYLYLNLTIWKRYWINFIFLIII